MPPLQQSLHHARNTERRRAFSTERRQSTTSPCPETRRRCADVEGVLPLPDQKGAGYQLPGVTSFSGDWTLQSAPRGVFNLTIGRRRSRGSAPHRLCSQNTCARPAERWGGGRLLGSPQRPECHCLCCSEATQHDPPRWLGLKCWCTLLCQFWTSVDRIHCF